MRPWFGVAPACLLALGVLTAPAVRADDMLAPGCRSASSAILGAEGWYAGALPPPGLHLVDYNFLYHAHEMKGRRGGHVSDPPFTDFTATVYAQVIRPVYVSKHTILGANPAWHAVIPFIYKEMESDFFGESKFGLGDVYVSPLLLGWHRPPWHWVAGLDVICPTGRYDSRDVVTIGNNHWTFEPAVAVSYIGTGGFSASTKLMYDIHTEDRRLDYKEGDQFHLDYNLGYSWGGQRQWRAGLCGYYLTSMAEDKQDGRRLPGSEEKVFAIGPTVSYQWGRLNIEAKLQHEMHAKNRPEGTAGWLKLIYSF
ncbi:MAG: hypothetical protein GXY85_08905 [Candidatus Brocadiaceae bacterium]|nr:hypothetical protein [Candidatus Brocadiaceae bacterium]